MATLLDVRALVGSYGSVSQPSRPIPPPATSATTKTVHAIARDRQDMAHFAAPKNKHMRSAKTQNAYH